jgi:hypothetical protein
LLAQDRLSPRSTGHVLLLQNQGILEGEIERHGPQYRVRRGDSETWVAAERVMWLCADWEEAFAILSRQANLHDPDERVRLARWCEHNGLHAHALAEATAAVRLRPEHAGARRLLERLQNAVAQAPAPASTKPAEAAEEAVPAVDLNAESLALFTSRVQPILMNACACCHATGRGGKFKLVRCYDATVNRRGLHQNLAAVLAQIDLDEPTSSPLIYKAFSAHGGTSKAPLPGRQSPPCQILGDWVETVVANNPHLRKALGRPKKTAAEDMFGPPAVRPPHQGADAAPTLPEARPVSQERPVVSVGSGQAPGSVVSAPTPAAPPTQVSPASPLAAAGPTAPAFAGQEPAPGPTQTAPRDPYDPWIFNVKLRPPQ